MGEFAERYGPWAVVAGASVGIGAEFCRQFAAEGVNVVLVSRSVDKLEALAGELTSDYGVETRVAAIDLAAPGAEPTCSPPPTGSRSGSSCTTRAPTR